MKTIILSFLLIFLLGFSALAQDKNESREKIKSLKIAYLTEQLALTSSEAEKFWPIYNAFDKEQHDLRGKQRSEMRTAFKNNGNIESINEKEAEKLINMRLEIDKQMQESQKDFIEKIRSVISNKKILKMQIAEMEFSRNLLKKYHQKDKKKE